MTTAATTTAATSAATTTATIKDWFASKLPADWFAGPPEITVDADEVLVVGSLSPLPDGSGEEAAADQIHQFREATRDQRIVIALEAEALFQRKVSWGAASGPRRVIFTSLSSPVMTRLRITERSVLDTLVSAGVARSRSDALAWCVRLVGQHESDWLTDLRDALVHVHKVRAEGPTAI
jgi:hypothetical protein